LAGEFVRAHAAGVNWHQIHLDPYPKGKKLEEELDELVALVEYRAGVMSEALAERKNLGNYWRGY
jgi:hypothetical protein